MLTDPIELQSKPQASKLARRYDVDWLRTIAMALLIIYHVVITFMPWATYIGFPQNDTSLDWVWIFMAVINIWRIPLLFLISGMGVRFAMQRRNWKELLKDRTMRLLVPYLFGIIVLEYLVNAAALSLGWDATYNLTFGHLWFLLNIFLYVVWLIGIIIYWKDHPDNSFFRLLSKVLRWRFGIFLFALPIVIEAWLVNPQYFTTYVDNVHGWLLGLICFTLGFIFISLKDVFWPAVEKNRWPALIVAFLLYLVRLFAFELQTTPNALIAIEAMSWMLAILGFASLYLNKPSRTLNYFNTAVYPVYIVHMPLQFIGAYFLLHLPLHPFLKLTLLLLVTFGSSLLLYEIVLRRIKWLRPLFGMKLSRD